MTANVQPRGDASLLARRLRELREQGVVRLTQTKLGRALADETGLSAASISMWEKPDSGRLPPRPRLEAYARLFCTPVPSRASPGCWPTASSPPKSKTGFRSFWRSCSGCAASGSSPV